MSFLQKLTLRACFSSEQKQIIYDKVRIIATTVYAKFNSNFLLLLDKKYADFWPNLKWHLHVNMNQIKKMVAG
jgi:hypothetical protein